MNQGHGTALPIPLPDADAILERMRDDEESDWPHKLLEAIGNQSRTPTPAELRVLDCVSRGMTGQMTADTLGLSLETVRTQLVTARLRLRAKNTCHACCEAIRLGLL